MTLHYFIELQQNEPLEECIVLSFSHDLENEFQVVYDYAHDQVHAKFSGTPVEPGREVRCVTFTEVTALEVTGSQWCRDLDSVTKASKFVSERAVVVTYVQTRTVAERLAVRMKFQEYFQISFEARPEVAIEAKKLRAIRKGADWLYVDEKGEPVQLNDPFR